MSLPILDNISHGSTSSASTVTVSHTVTALHPGNTILTVWVMSGNTGQTVSGVTYNGVSMVPEKSQAFTNGPGFENLYAFALTNPAVGANNIVMSGSGTGDYDLLGMSFYNVVNAAPFGPFTANAGGSGSLSNSVAATAPNQLILDFAGASGTLTPSAGQTIINSDSTVWDVYVGAIAGAGLPLALSWSNPGNGVWAEISVALNGPPALQAPFVTPGAVIGPSIWQGPPGLKYPSKMGPVIRRANGIFRGGGGLMGKNILRRKWWQVL